MAEIKSRQIHLKKRPSGMPELSDFELVQVSVPEPGEGQVLVRNLFMSVDPYMRGRMDASQGSYVAPFALGEPLDGRSVGRVIASRSSQFQEGDCVESFQGWREHFLAEGSELGKIDASVAPVQAYLSVLGMPGMTAWVGLREIATARPGETVMVSGAAGAVGSVACQIAKIDGCRVVGSAGSQEKIDWLRQEAGIDTAYNYRTSPDLNEVLEEHCPQGIDLFFENVGGPQFEAVFARMNDYGRILVCGSIAGYNDPSLDTGPRSLRAITRKRLAISGFIVSDHLEKRGQFRNDMQGWIAQGKIKWQETIVEGIENAPQAFRMLFTGENQGKMLVRLGEEP